jgi:hypothetical protein
MTNTPYLPVERQRELAVNRSNQYVCFQTQRKMRTFCVWTNFLQQEYVISQKIKCKNQHRLEIGVQFEVYVLITALQIFLFLKEEHAASRWPHY